MAAKNAQPEQPQLYIITPAEFELDVFPDLLARVLDAQPIACVRMAMASQDELRLSKAADSLREVTRTFVRRDPVGRSADRLARTG